MIQDIDANMCQEVVCALFRSCFRIETPGLNAKCSAYTVRLPSFEPKPRDFFFHNYCKTFFFWNATHNWFRVCRIYTFILCICRGVFTTIICFEGVSSMHWGEAMEWLLNFHRLGAGSYEFFCFIRLCLATLEIVDYIYNCTQLFHPYCSSVVHTWPTSKCVMHV